MSIHQHMDINHLTSLFQHAYLINVNESFSLLDCHLLSTAAFHCAVPGCDANRRPSILLRSFTSLVEFVTLQAPQGDRNSALAVPKHSGSIEQY